MWTHFSWEFQGGHTTICTNSFKHVFIALRVCKYAWDGRSEELTMWPRHKKNWNIFSTSREYCILLICWSLTSWLHFLNKASTNTIERSTTWDIWTSFCLYISILFIRIPALLLRPLRINWLFALRSIQQHKSVLFCQQYETDFEIFKHFNSSALRASVSSLVIAIQVRVESTFRFSSALKGQVMML